MKPATSEPTKRVKPRLRGVSHRYAFFACLVPSILLVYSAPTPRAAFGAGLYVASLAALLGTSALYHGVNWSPDARRWMARLDLVMIFMLIAGTTTPIALLALEPPMSRTVLIGVWTLAVAGSLFEACWTTSPKWVNSVVYVAVGLFGVVFMPDVASSLGATPTVLLAAGGLVYIAGAVIYALEWPDPRPSVFGYHEIFHGFVIVAAAIHFVVVALYVVPHAA